MNFRDWQDLPPLEAAREVRQRVQLHLSPEQQRAVIAWLPSERSLSEAFSSTPGNAPLTRVPFFLKDLFDVAGVPTFAGSTFLPEVRATLRDSALVQRLRSSGAVLAGKTQLHEFAYGITGENPHYGDCEHPRLPGRTSGGSSSGSAAAVAAGVVPFAIGTDTGGSIRVPAAFCGIFGFRLGAGDENIRDAFPLAPSFDTAGWFTACASDMLRAIDALVGNAPNSRPLRACYLEMPGVDADVATACRAAAANLGVIADDVTGAELRQLFAGSETAYNQIVAAEAWATHQSWAEKFRDRYDPNVWQRLNRFHSLTPATIDLAAQRLVEIRRTWEQYFASFDFLVMPATPFGALTKAECTLENRNRILTLTAPASIGGLPVLTVPVSLASGLTSGIQIIVKNPQSAAISTTLKSLISVPPRV